MDSKYENLIRRITSVGLDIDSESPADIQVDGSTDGVLHFLEYDVDDEGYITTLPREYDGTFADAIQAAIDCVAKDLTIGGLSRDEAVELLMSPDFRAKTLELIDYCGAWGGLEINGTRFTFEDGQLVNEDFGPWPFEDEDA